MSLTSTNSDACYLRQQTEDGRKAYAYQMNPVQNFRPEPAPQGAGVYVDRAGNGQSQVDLESLLRNQSFVDSRCPAYRNQADNCLLPYMRRQEGSLPCVQNELVPQVQFHSRSCDPLAGLSIDRFDPLLFQGMAFQYGYAAIPSNTTLEFKNQLEKQRNQF